MSWPAVTLAETYPDRQYDSTFGRQNASWAILGPFLGIRFLPVIR